MESVSSPLLSNPDLFKLEPFNKGDLLKGLFLYQRALVDKYIVLGRLPELPITFNERSGQKFLRKLIADLNEELGEASIEYDKTEEWLDDNVWTNKDAHPELRSICQATVDELGDSLHFFIELMIYSGLDADDVLQSTSLATKGLGLFFEEPLANTFSLARHLNITIGSARMSKFAAYRWTPDADMPKVGIDLLQEANLQMWATVKSLLHAQNFLKIKDWRGQEEVQANLQGFQDAILNAWLKFITYIDLIDIDAISLYATYERMNFKNQERLQNNY